MNKKSVLGLFLFSCAVIAGLFLGTMLMIRQQPYPDYSQNQQDISNEAANEDSEPEIEEDDNSQDQSIGSISEEEWYYSDNTDTNSQDISKDPVNADDINSSDTDAEQTDSLNEPEDSNLNSEESNSSDNEDTSGSNEEMPDDNETDDGQDSTDYASESDNIEYTDTIGDDILELPDMELICDSSQVDYMNYIPDMVYDSKIESDLDIINPILDIKAKSAILIDAKTGKVLYYKEPIVPVFPASTSKLLTALVTLDWCMEEEEVVVGDEIKLVASDSTLARLKKGQVLTIRNALEGMLVPSGNDAAYVLAAYVGRKSLRNDDANLKEVIPEFIRLMNDKAKSLGAVNSVFKTPDGYDAIGQYTTAYDMGMIGMAAADNVTIVEICSKASARNVFLDGYDVTWNNTNSLIVKESGRYYPYCIGLKTGTSTMAGRCLISAAKKDGKEVISVVMNSDAAGRWEDSTTLLKYGLEN